MNSPLTTICTALQRSSRHVRLISTESSEAIITNSSLKAISVLGATCFAIVAATYKMIKDESFQTQNQFNVLRDETQRGFEKISNKLDRIDEQIHKYNERLANVEGQLDVLRNKK